MLYPFNHSKSSLEKLKEFLKGLPCAQVSPMKVGACIVDEGVVKAIEEDVAVILVCCYKVF